MVQIDMEMPKNCNECEFGKQEGQEFGLRIKCFITDISFPYYSDAKKRFTLCPLREVK